MTNKKKRALKRIHYLFIEHYLDCFDAGRAARRAGYDAYYDLSRMSSVGRYLLRRPAIASEIERRLVQNIRGMGVTKGRVLAEVSFSAFFDVRKLYDEEGFPLSPHELDDETARAITGIKVGETRIRHDKDSEETVEYSTKEFKTDKAGSLRLLMQHLGLLNEGVGEERKDRLQEIVDALRHPVTDTPAGSPPPLPVGEEKPEKPKPDKDKNR